jgi:hypothetical protein
MRQFECLEIMPLEHNARAFAYNRLPWQLGSVVWLEMFQPEHGLSRPFPLRSASGVLILHIIMWVGCQAFPSCIAARYSGVTWKRGKHGCHLPVYEVRKFNNIGNSASPNRALCPSIYVWQRWKGRRCRRLLGYYSGRLPEFSANTNGRPRLGPREGELTLLLIGRGQMDGDSAESHSRRSQAESRAHRLDSPLRLARKHPICAPHRYGPRSTRRESFNIDSIVTPIHSSRIVQHRPRSTRRESFNSIPSLQSIPWFHSLGTRPVTHSSESSAVPGGLPHRA